MKKQKKRPEENYDGFEISVRNCETKEWDISLSYQNDQKIQDIKIEHFIGLIQSLEVILAEAKENGILKININ